MTAFLTLEIRQDERAGGGHDTVGAHLAAIPEVLEAHTITGAGDLMARVVARSNTDLQRVIDLVLAHAGDRPVLDGDRAGHPGALPGAPTGRGLRTERIRRSHVWSSPAGESADAGPRRRGSLLPGGGSSMDDGVVVMVDGRAKVLQRTCRRDDELLRRLLRTRPDLVLGAAMPGRPPSPPAGHRHRRPALAARVRRQRGGPAPRRRAGDRPRPGATSTCSCACSTASRWSCRPGGTDGCASWPRATHDDRDEAELLTQALDWRADPDTFWARVESNLSRDRVRIVLVTDRVPDELTRIVEFLDGQLRDVEVRAVEVSLYGSGQVSALVPRSTRPGSAAPGARHVEPPPGLMDLAAQAAPGADGPGRHRKEGSS